MKKEFTSYKNIMKYGSKLDVKKSHDFNSNISTKPIKAKPEPAKDDPKVKELAKDFNHYFGTHSPVLESPLDSINICYDIGMIVNGVFKTPPLFDGWKCVGRYALMQKGDILVCPFTPSNLNCHPDKGINVNPSYIGDTAESSYALEKDSIWTIYRPIGDKVKYEKWIILSDDQITIREDIILANSQDNPNDQTKLNIGTVWECYQIEAIKCGKDCVAIAKMKMKQLGFSACVFWRNISPPPRRPMNKSFSSPLPLP